MLPISLDITNRLVVVVGGGSVGYRKAAAAVNSSARVKIIDPRPVRTDPPIEHIAEYYSSSHLDGASLVFACATEETNTRVVADARLRGIWVNSATDPSGGDFVLPSVLRRGRLSIAIATGNASPSLARNIRQKLESDFDASFADWIDLLAEIRSIVISEISDPEQRRRLLQDLADWKWLGVLRGHGVNGTRLQMLDEVRKQKRSFAD